MKKYTGILFLFILFHGLSKARETGNAYPKSAALAHSPIPSNRLIIPGVRIGLSSIFEKSTEIFKTLGQPATTDGSIGGKSLDSWFSKPVLQAGVSVVNETNIYFTTPDMGMPKAAARAKIIRVTSPSFVTKQKIGTGTSLTRIRQYFPGIKKVASCIHPKTKQELLIYQDTDAGIAFEIDSLQTCRGIAIFKPGDDPLILYTGLFENIKDLTALPATPVQIGLQDNGKTYQLAVNEKFEVRLNECVGCQYVWEITGIDKDKIAFLENTYSNKSCTNCTGGNQDNTFHFLAKAKGRSVLSFTYFKHTLSVTINTR